MEKSCIYKTDTSGGGTYSCCRDALADSDFCYLHDVNITADKKVGFLKDEFTNGLSGADLTGAYLPGADLKGLNLERAILEKGNFENTNLKGAVLKDANLKEAHFTGADLKGGFLSDANLELADLTEADLSGAFLKGANLENSNLYGATLKGAFLLEANLKWAHLTEADFTEANLIDSDMSGANLIGANFKEADLSAANLADAFIEGFKINNTNLINVIWVEKRPDNKGGDLSRIRCTLHELVQIKNYYQEMGNFSLADAFYVEQMERIQRLIPKSERTLLNRTGYGFWKLSSNYGVSLVRWQLLFFSMATFFGSLYWKFDLVRYSNHPADPVTGFSNFYFSFITITTLGFGDIIAKKGIGEFVVTVEVLIGYMMLVVLMGIFTKKFIRN